MHTVYTTAKINIQFTWLHMYSVIEIRVRIWLAVFEDGTFCGLLMAFPLYIKVGQPKWILVWHLLKLVGNWPAVISRTVYSNTKRVFGCTVSEYSSCTNYKFQGIWYFSNYSIIKHKSTIFILKWLIHTILIFARFSIQTI